MCKCWVTLEPGLPSLLVNRALERTIVWFSFVQTSKCRLYKYYYNIFYYWCPVFFCFIGRPVLLSPLTTASNRFFFNETSLIQVSSAVVPLTSGFDLTFRTCNGGVLFSQKGTNNGFFTLEVVPTVVNYSHTPTLFIASRLRMTWEISGTRQFVTVGTKLDQNFNYKVEFVAGSGSEP